MTISGTRSSLDTVRMIWTLVAKLHIKRFTSNISFNSQDDMCYKYYYSLHFADEKNCLLQVWSVLPNVTQQGENKWKCLQFVSGVKSTLAKSLPFIFITFLQSQFGIHTVPNRLPEQCFPMMSLSFAVLSRDSDGHKQCLWTETSMSQRHRMCSPCCIHFLFYYATPKSPKQSSAAAYEAT